MPLYVLIIMSQNAKRYEKSLRKKKSFNLHKGF